MRWSRRVRPPPGRILRHKEFGSVSWNLATRKRAGYTCGLSTRAQDGWAIADRPVGEYGFQRGVDIRVEAHTGVRAAHLDALGLAEAGIKDLLGIAEEGTAAAASKASKLASEAEKLAEEPPCPAGGFGPHARAVNAGMRAACFRGTKPGESPDFTPRHNDYKVDPATGLVKGTHGVSIFDNPASVAGPGFVPNEIDMNSVPNSLQIIRGGVDPRNF
jgi:hypothetical protein